MYALRVAAQALVLAIVLPLSSVLIAQEQSQPNWALNFGQFPVKTLYKGKPAPARIVTNSDRYFRTRIREGARKGPNFAGHFTIVEWGCGSGCLSSSVIDAITGRIYPMAFGPLLLPYTGTESGRSYEGLVYRLNSRLLIADGCPEDKSCGMYYLEWNGSRFKQLKFEPQPEQKPE